MTDPNGLIRPGRPAPGFTLPATPDGRQVGPEQFRGHPVVLAFYPADWTPVCGDQMALYQAAMPELERTTPWCSASRWTASGRTRRSPTAAGIRFPLLADFEPKGEVARRYGAYTPQGQAARALVVVDPPGHGAPGATSPRPTSTRAWTASSTRWTGSAADRQVMAG